MNSNDTQNKYSPFNLGCESESVVKQSCLVHLRHEASHTFDDNDDFFSASVLRAVLTHKNFPIIFENLFASPTALIRRLDSRFSQVFSQDHIDSFVSSFQSGSWVLVAVISLLCRLMLLSERLEDVVKDRMSYRKT